MGEVFPQAKPFVKWAGGKAQLVQELCKRLPKEILQTKRIDVYVEPFVGGGAFFFYLKGRFKIGKAFLFDVNKDLVIAFKVVQNFERELVEQLGLLEENYLSLSEEKRKDFYYEVRDKYNKQRGSFDYSQCGRSWVLRAAYMIFLNKTCYNGLYRLNRQGRFNVPHGKNKKPKICDEKNIFEASMALKDTEIICADFEESKNYVTSGALVYLDPHTDLSRRLQVLQAIRIRVSVMKTRKGSEGSSGRCMKKGLIFCLATRTPGTPTLTMTF